MFKDAIKGLLWIINALLSGTINSGNLSTTLPNFNEDIYNFVTDISSGIISTVALMILSLCAMLEFLKMTTKTEGMGGGVMSVETIGKVLFKIFFCKLIIDNSSVIMNAIYDASLYLINGIRGAIPGGTPGADVLDLTALNLVIDNAGMGDQILALLVAIIVLLVIAIICIIVDVIIVARFIEIYILLSISPIPIATICHDEFSQIAKNFIKTFAAICLQGVLLLLVIGFFPLLLDSEFLKNAENGSVTMSLLPVLGYSFILALAVFSTQKWAKSIFNAM
jgi:Type IV secretory pathway, VirB6 components